jgi:hypothetical protein
VHEYRRWKTSSSRRLDVLTLSGAYYEKNLVGPGGHSLILNYHRPPHQKCGSFSDPPTLTSSSRRSSSDTSVTERELRLVAEHACVRGDPTDDSDGDAPPRRTGGADTRPEPPRDETLNRSRRARDRPPEGGSLVYRKDGDEPRRANGAEAAAR